VGQPTLPHSVLSRDEWLARRAELLQEEKALTQARAQLAALRRELPWVRLNRDYPLIGAGVRIPLIVTADSGNRYKSFTFRRNDRSRSTQPAQAVPAEHNAR